MQEKKARGRIRTNDRGITNAVLFQLSYAGNLFTTKDLRIQGNSPLLFLKIRAHSVMHFCDEAANMKLEVFDIRKSSFCKIRIGGRSWQGVFPQRNEKQLRRSFKTRAEAEIFARKKASEIKRLIVEAVRRAKKPPENLGA